MSDGHKSAGVAPETDPPTAANLPLLVGRDRELAQVGAILWHRRPALVIVSAATGMGKTSMLRMAEARAIEQGWHTAYSDSDGELSVTLATTEEIFSQRVLTLLGSLVGSTTDPSRLSSLHQLAEQLRRQAPVLLIVDGYRPAPAFASWFTNRFMREIKSAGTSVVVVVADQAGNVDMLLSFADDVITLGPLDRQAVKQHLELVGQRITPPIDAAELDVYVETACKDPAILGSLSRLLELAQPDRGSASRGSRSRDSNTG